MSAGIRASGPWGRSRRRRRGQAAVDLTPMIDIVFQLLIFFLLTATFKDTSSLDVDLARATNRERTQVQQAVVLSIGTDGQFEIDRKVVDPRELEMRLCQRSQQGSDTIHIRADESSEHRALVTAMDLAKRCGFGKMGILHQN